VENPIAHLAFTPTGGHDAKRRRGHERVPAIGRTVQACGLAPRLQICASVEQPTELGIGVVAKFACEDGVVRRLEQNLPVGQETAHLVRGEEGAACQVGGGAGAGAAGAKSVSALRLAPGAGLVGFCRVTESAADPVRSIRCR
jgi:hypothetical protein